MAEINNSQRKKIVKVGLLETFAELVDTLYGSPMGASGEHHAPGQVPDPGATAGSSKFLCEDGTWKEPSGGGGSNISVMGASGSNHASGLVPDPGATAGTTKFLREDGTWQIPIDENTQYTAATESVDGLMSKEDKTKLNGYPSKTNGSSKFLREDGTWQIPPTGFAKIRVNIQEIVGTNLGAGLALLGLVISLLNITDNVTVTQTWEGNLLVFDNLIPGKNYRLSAQEKPGYLLPDAYYDINYIGVGADITKLFSYEQNRILSGYIILDLTTTDPTKKVIDESGKTYSTGFTRSGAINRIRELSHCYVGTYNSGTMYLKQIDDLNGTLYADGTSCATDITNHDVFMRLPVFYTKVSEYATDKTKIEFWIDSRQQSSPSETGWKQWGGNDLIGKYEGAYGGVSRSGRTPGGNYNWYEFYNSMSSKRSNGFSMTKLQHHNIMGILFYAYYGHTNSQLLCGSGTSSKKTTGLKNANGMTDTTSLTGNRDGTVFWGLENWWGNCLEHLENIHILNGICTITEDDGSTRTIDFSNYKTGQFVYPTKFILGDNLDLISVEDAQYVGTDSTGYCDALWFTKNSSTLYASRSCDGKSGYAGVGFLNCNLGSSFSYDGCGIRLAYKGPIEIVN